MRLLIALCSAISIACTAHAEPCVDAKAAIANHGTYAVLDDRYHARVIRRDVDCARVVAALPELGPIAFITLEDGKDKSAPPDVYLDTWLMHGDRLSHHLVWSGGTYIEVGRPREILGPRPR